MLQVAPDMNARDKRRLNPLRLKDPPSGAATGLQALLHCRMLSRAFYQRLRLRLDRRGALAVASPAIRFLGQSVFLPMDRSAGGLPLRLLVLALHIYQDQDHLSLC